MTLNRAPVYGWMGKSQVNQTLHVLTHGIYKKRHFLHIFQPVVVSGFICKLLHNVYPVWICVRGKGK